MKDNIEEKILDLALKNADSAEVIYEEGESRSISFENNKLKSVYTKEKHSGKQGRSPFSGILLLPHVAIFDQRPSCIVVTSSAKLWILTSINVTITGPITLLRMFIYHIPM